MDPPASEPLNRMRRYLLLAGWWLGGIVGGFALGAMVDSVAGRAAGKAALRVVLYSCVVTGIGLWTGRPLRKSLLQGVAFGAGIAALRWLLDVVW